MKKIKGEVLNILNGIRKEFSNILKISAQCPLIALKTICRDDLELRVDTKNKIRLYFKGVELTKSAGFSGSVLSEGVWHGLSEALIKIDKIAQHKMALFIKFKNIPLIQHWIIELAPGSQINWNIEMETEKPLRIDAVRAGVFFSKYYETLFDAKAQESRFPYFTENQKICYETKELDFIGLKAGDLQMPPLTFKADGVPFTFSIQNTGIEQSSRVLEIRFEEEKELYQPGVYPYLKASFRIYPDKTVLEGILKKIRHDQEQKRQSEERKRLEEEEKKRLDDELKRQEEEQKRQAEERKRLEEEALKRQEEEKKRLDEELKKQEEEKRLLDEESKRQDQEQKRQEQELIRQEEEKNRQDQERKRLEDQEKKRLDEEFKRQEEEKKRQEMELRRQEEEKKRQEIEFKRQEEDRKRQSEERKRLEEQEFKIQTEEQKRQEQERKRQEEEQKRQAEERKRLEAEELKRQEEEKKRLDEELKKQEEEKRLLDEESKRQDQEQKRQEQELKRQEEEKKRLDEELKKQEEEKRLLEEELERQKQEQKKLQDQEQKRQKKDQKLRILKSGSFTLCLDTHNRFHISYKDNEITKGIGLNAGIFSEGNWYGSSDSQARIERPSSNKMVIYFTHNKIPMIQTWYLRVLPEDVMEWEVKMHIKEPLRIDIRNASLFLSKAYKGWIASPKEGDFPDGFGSEWQMMSTSSVSQSNFIGLYSLLEELPDIALKDLKNSKSSFSIQNTGIEQSSRVLEIRFEEEKELYQPGVYPYLKASFRIYPDKTVLEGILKKIRHDQEQKRQSEERKRLEEEKKRQELELKRQKYEQRRQNEERERLEEVEKKRLAEERKRQEEEKKQRELELKRQEEELERQKQEQKKLQDQEQKRQSEEREKQEEILKRMQEKIKKIYVKPDETADLVVLKEDYIKKEGSIYIYGDNENLHDRISSMCGDFKKSVSRMETAIDKNKNIKIGVSRFNFFKLNEIAQFCSSMMNQRLDLRSVILNPLPVSRLYLNFFDYIKELNARIGSGRIEFFLKDEKLLGLLYSISSQADQYNEKELLRLLGVISEHAFIGPQTIVLDISHRCNTNCIHCWIHTPRRTLPRELTNLKMSLSLYKNIIDDAVDLLCDEIIIQGDGEPLLDNRFMEMVQYARNKGLKVIFFTNAILLDKKKANKIIELEIDEIYCSLPAGTDKTYAVINSKQSKETFHRIAYNLKNLISLRNKLKRSKPSLQMTHVIHDLNHHELEEMARLDVHIGADKARFYLARLDENIKFLKVKTGHIEVIKESLKKIAPYLKKEHVELQDNIWFQLKNYNSKTGRWSGGKFLKSGCPVGWFFCMILARGELSMCCHLRVVDYLGGKSFREAWNSGSYDKFRSQAKHIMKNKNVVFRNGVKLYDEYCNNCDTHQVVLRISELLKKHNLEQFHKDTLI